jgi:calcineurin-like phosphoesterase family protein
MITNLSGNGLFFTSDTHFGHKHILNFCNRPYSCIEEHDRALIDNWNSVIGPNDTVFHLGDFGFGGFPFWKQIREQLNGNIILVVGNHDWKNLTAGSKLLFDECISQARLTIDGQTVYLNHFPFLCFAHGNPETYKDAYHIQLYGHVHSGPLSTSNDMARCSILYPTQYDVGVDNNNYTPISWNDVKSKIQNQIDKYSLNK